MLNLRLNQNVKGSGVRNYFLSMTNIQQQWHCHQRHADEQRYRPSELADISSSLSFVFWRWLMLDHCLSWLTVAAIVRCMMWISFSSHATTEDVVSFRSVQYRIDSSFENFRKRKRDLVLFNWSLRQWQHSEVLSMRQKTSTTQQRSIECTQRRYVLSRFTVDTSTWSIDNKYSSEQINVAVKKLLEIKKQAQYCLWSLGWMRSFFCGLLYRNVSIHSL